MPGNGVLIDGIMTLLQMMLLIIKAVLLPILKVVRMDLTASYVAAVGTATRTTALWAYGTSTVLTTGSTFLASGWLVGLEFTYFAGKVEQRRA